MRQFDVCRLKTRPRQLVVILQHDTADELATRVVAPLSAEPYRQLIVRLRIPIAFAGAQYVVQLDRMAAIRVGDIGPAEGSLVTFEQALKNGIDLLLFGV